MIIRMLKMSLFCMVFFASYTYAQVRLIMQCEFSNFFEDFKIQGAAGFSSDHPFIKKIHADTTAVGLLYHPAVGLYCGAIPLLPKDFAQKKIVAQVVSLMWPHILNGTRDRIVDSYRKNMENINNSIHYPIKKDYTEDIAIIDLVLRDHVDNKDTLQMAYNTTKNSMFLANDSKQKNILYDQMKKIELYLGNNQQKGLS